MCDVLQRYTDLDQKTALRISQFSCPIVTQLVAGPVQLLGLDFYNRPLQTHTYSQAILERLTFQRTHFTSIIIARVSRIAPAYGLGGIGNTYFRDGWREMLLRREEEEYDVVSMDMDDAEEEEEEELMVDVGNTTILGTCATEDDC
jgi:hypothetical protein